MEIRPKVGDTVLMGIDDDVQIEICEVPEFQPFVSTDELFIIIDQYGEEHLVKRSDDDWLTKSVDTLSPEGFMRWLERADNAKSQSPLP